MAQPVHLPKVGMTMEEGTLCRWLVADGVPVSAGQPLFEMETEKVKMEVESDGPGVLRQLVEEGTKLKPGDVVGCLLAPGEEAPRDILDLVAAQLAREATMGSSSRAVEAEATATRVAGQAGRLRVSPVARRLAEQSGIDLTRVRGTGPDGRITEQDVRSEIARPAGAPSTPSRSNAPAGEAPGSAIPYGGRRRTIGDRMRQSLQTAAQLTLSTETGVGDAVRMVHGLNREWRHDGVVVTLTALIVRACALALREHPNLNARLDGDQILLLDDVNVGIAVDLPEGLMVPVVAHADTSSLKDVAKTLADLTERAKGGALKLEDMTGGTFTVTSLDSYGIDVFTPIINPPQTAILGVGRVRDVAGFEGTEVVRRQAVTLNLSFDHRVVDGGPAARFLHRICELLDRPYLLM